MPVEIEDAQVVAAQFVADVGQHRLGAEGGGEAVGHVAGDAQGIFGVKGRLGMPSRSNSSGAGLFSWNWLTRPGRPPALSRAATACPGGRCIRRRGRGCAECGTDGRYPPAWVRALRPARARQAPQHFHLEQAVLGVHVAEGAVEVGLVLRIQVRNPALVVAHVDRRLQVGQGERAVAERLLGMEVPGAAGSGGDRHGDHGQGAFHRSFLLVVVPSILRMPPARGIDRMLGPWKSLVNREEPPCRTTRLPAPDPFRHVAASVV